MRKNLIFIFLILIILTALISFWLIFLPIDSFSEEEIIFSVEKGSGSRGIALNLKGENLIRRTSAFRVYVLFKGIAKNLKAGEYILSPSMNIPQIAEKFFRGEVIKQKITIIEGWNLREIGFYFENKEMFQSEEVWQVTGKDFSDDFDFLKDKPKNLALEGYLFPDTYELIKEEGLESIIKRMLGNFDRKLTPELREEIDNRERSIFEVITMASLIEKEVRKLEHKKLVSGILWKRLEINMPLQVDATIAYILEVERWELEEDKSSSRPGATAWDFDQMRREIALNKDIDSPYNTYKRPGLPLGPISNPGLDSIIAAIYPKESDYWYYLSTPEGDTIFSRTLAEHNAAKTKYFK